MPENCNDCGGFTNGEELGSYYWKNSEECTCIRCQGCDKVIGNTVEPDWWNDDERLIHGQECNGAYL